MTLAELVYNPRHSDKDDVKGIGDLVSKTVPQKPDIVLQLTKNDLQQGMKLTYLFDAKYRLEKDGETDVPPDDAINQMHRYRDAIYYKSRHADERLKKSSEATSSSPATWTKSHTYTRALAMRM